MTHDHTWDLASAVLVGALEDTTFRACPAADGPFVVYHHVYSEGRLASTGETVELVEARKRKVAQGVVYRISAGTPHVTHVDELPTLTLVVANETGRDRAAIYADRTTQASRPSDRVAVPPEVAQRELLMAIGVTP
jgi:hypothetical protein